MMDEATLNALADDLAGAFAELYAAQCAKAPKALVLMAMTGALAACATEAGAARENIVAAINSAFDDIEAGEPR
jgi:hypothetical protein